MSGYETLIRRLHAARQAGGLTRADVETAHAECRAASDGAVTDDGTRDRPLRDLRRMLFTLAFDAAHWPLAGQMLELAQPPELGESDADVEEWLNWRNAQAMYLDATGQHDGARAAFSCLGEDYLALPAPDASRFALLTNAVQAACELGDHPRGESLLLRAEVLARSWADVPNVAFNLGLARMFPPLIADDGPLFSTRHAEMMALAQASRPDLIPQLERFAVLSFLQMGLPAEAAARLPDAPPEDGPVPELLADTLVRLQARLAIGLGSGLASELASGPVSEDVVLEALIRQGLWLLAHDEARGQHAVLCAVLALALFRIGQIGPALLMATAFLRDPGAMIASLPRHPQEARARRERLLSVLEPLQSTLILAGYFRAGEEVAALHAVLRHGGVLPADGWRGWAPGPVVARDVGRLEQAIADARSGQGQAAAIVDMVMRASIPPVPPLARQETPGLLSVGFVPDGAGLRLIVQSDRQEQSFPVGLSPEMLARTAGELRRDLAIGNLPGAEADVLAQALFEAVRDRLADAREIHIAPFGVAAGLPFNLLLARLLPDLQPPAVIIRTCVPVPENPPLAGASLRILSATGEGATALPQAFEEGEAIRLIHRAPAGAHIPGFSANDLAQSRAERPDILHIAAHFRPGPGKGGEGSLIAGDGSVVPLSVAFPADTPPVAARLIYLSGCETVAQDGLQEAGQDVRQSLAARLNALGYRHVIASLWPVEDGASRAIAEAVHQGLVQGLAPASALAAAIARLRQIHTLDHPSNWAAFQCYTT